MGITSTGTNYKGISCKLSSRNVRGNIQGVPQYFVQEIFDFSFWGSILKNYIFKATIILEIAMFMFDFLNLPAF